MKSNEQTKKKHITGIESTKGGVGKTTSTSVIAQLLAVSGQKVLIVDMDSQKSLTDVMAKDLNTVPAVSINNVVLKDLSLEELESAIVPTQMENIDMIPADDELAELIYLIHDISKEEPKVIFHFRDNLQKILNAHYDHVLIDTAPALSYLSTITTIACDMILCPIEADNLSFQSIVNVRDLVDKTQKYYSLEEEKSFYVFATRVQNRTTRTKMMLAGYEEQLGDIFLPTSIRASEVIARANTSFVPIMMSPDKKNECINEYIDLLKSIDYLDGKQFRKVKRYQEGTSQKKQNTARKGNK